MGERIYGSRITDVDYRINIDVSTHKDGVCERDAIWEDVLNRNYNITINQIKDGIKYGWYSYDHKGKVIILINQYNEHLWKDAKDECPF